MNKHSTIAYKHIQTSKIRLHVAFSGPEEGEPVILLHGFPDASFGWNHQINTLASQGFYVIAPDQRGYNLSDKPRGRDSYKMDLLVEDIIALANELQLERFYLAGHDFGALVSWYLVEKYPKRVKRLVIINVPHPTTLDKFLKERKEQRRRSWYAYFFRIPILPEFLIRITNWRLLKSAMKHSFSEERLQEYRKAWSQPGALKAMINWYRCLFRLADEEKPKNKVSIPTLIIWGKKDPHLMWEMAEESAKMCKDVRIEYFEDATHWVLEDEPEKSSKLLCAYFSEKTSDYKENEG